MEKVLCVCETHYQLMIAIQLRLTLYKHDQVDCLITDYFDDLENLRVRLNNIDVFDNVYAISRRRYQSNALHQAMIFITGKYPPLATIPDDYTVLLFSRLSQITTALLVRRKDIQAKIIEDSFLLYIYNYTKLSFTTTNPFLNLLNYILCFRIGFSVKQFFNKKIDFFAFSPDLVNQNIVPFTPVQIPKLSLNEGDFRNAIDTLYGGAVSSAPIQKFIYLEHPMSKDVKISDEVFFADLVQMVGVQNISMKLHPRTVDNRFSKYGVAIWEYSNCPFEAYCLNENLSNRVLLTVHSTSAISARLHFGCKAKVVLLYKAFNIPPTLYDRSEFDGLLEKIMQKYDDNSGERWLYIPENMNELSEVLKKI